MQERIAVHEDSPPMPRTSFRQFQADMWAHYRRGELPSRDNIKDRIRAEVNHGRWIVRCPTAGCKNAFMASKADPFFLCYECGDGWFQIVFPLQAERIESLLVTRPDVEARNWTHDETAKDLERENCDRGID